MKYPDALIQAMDYQWPLIGLYDSPTTAGTKLVKPPEFKRSCIFSFFEKWIRGYTLQLTINNYGCKGCGHWLWNQQSRDHADFVDFLANKEGLKDSPALIEAWITRAQPYQPQYRNLLLGPLINELDPYLKTVSFFVNADQLSILMIGAQYFAQAQDPKPVIAPFGAGCMQLLPLIPVDDRPHALIGATDMAMRKWIPKNLIAFTVNRPMYNNLCKLDPERSYLGKSFLRELKAARGGSVN